MYVCMCVCMYVCMCVCMYVCVYVCMYVCVYLVNYERRARERDVEQLLQEKLLSADARKQDEENRPKT
jgi:hypothetical protein